MCSWGNFLCVYSNSYMRNCNTKEVQEDLGSAMAFSLRPKYLQLKTLPIAPPQTADFKMVGS